MSLNIAVKPSKIFNTFVLFTNAGLVLFSLYFVLFVKNTTFFSQICCALALVLIISVIIIKSRHRMIIDRISVMNNGEIKLCFREKTKYFTFARKTVRTKHVILQSNSLVLPYLLLLRFKVKLQSQTMVVCLLSDSVSKARFRSLSVAMQWVMKR